MNQKQKQILDALYEQNLKLGNRINTLSDENNFYKIQINNFNKLTNSINKDLYKLGINFQNKDIVEDSTKVGPLFVISNKIKLKNLQLKIGNSIRYTEKFKKNLDGSIPYINKQAEKLQFEVSMLLTRYLQVHEENQLLKNIKHANKLIQIYGEFKQQEQNHNKYNEITMTQLQNKKKQVLKKLQFMKKQQKQKSKILEELHASNQILQNQLNEIKSLLPSNKQVNKQRAQQAKQLQDLQNEQKKLQNFAALRSKQLQEQYAINKQCKQRITDKKYQQNKQIKVLEEQVLKCREQVRDFKLKYKKASEIKFKDGEKPIIMG